MLLLQFYVGMLIQKYKAKCGDPHLKSQEARQEDYCEFEDCLGFKVRPFLKSKTAKTINIPHIKHKLCTMASSLKTF